ncbi:MAG: hypothetical protein M3Y24_09380 [Acidobacteriota bacterium]|nr:hypothetical protein [Acidobacteriota bacterium]
MLVHLSEVDRSSATKIGSRTPDLESSQKYFLKSLEVKSLFSPKFKRDESGMLRASERVHGFKYRDQF